MERFWTKDEEDFLRSNYPIKGGRYCADKLNRGYSSINNEVCRLNITNISKK